MGEKSNKPVRASVGSLVSQAINNYTEMVANKEFDVPENYSYRNAIQQARYLLTKPAEGGRNSGKSIMEVCTPESIMQSVMEMAQKGLNPDKKQCYFIPYGSTCTLSVSYQGNVALAKRNGEDIGDVYGYAVYADDEFEIGFDLKKGTLEVKKYVPHVEKRAKDKIVGAFAVITDRRGNVKYTEYMTMDQVRAAWSMGAAKGNSPAHKNFPDQQAIKTVKSRAVKSFVNTADDGEIVQSGDQKRMTYADGELKADLETKANTLELEVEEPKEIPANVDPETGEIVEEVPEEIEGQADFFEDDFEALEEAPF